MKRQDTIPPTYDLLAYVYPADLQKCLKHRLANRIFKKIDVSKQQHKIRCESCKQQHEICKCCCCGKYVGQQSDANTFCYDPLEEFSYLGPGLPLLFVFVKNLIITLFLLVVIVAIQGIITNNSAKACQSETCSYRNIFSRLSITQKMLESGSIKVQLVLTLVFTLVMIIVNQYMIYCCRSCEKIADQRIFTPSDFAIFLLDLPEGTKKEDIQAMLNLTRNRVENELGNPNLSADKRVFLQKVRFFKVVDILIPKKLYNYTKQQRKEQERYQQYIKNDKISSFVRKDIEKPKESTNFAIVVFEKEITKKLFLKHFDFFEEVEYTICNWGLNQSQFIVKNKNISVVRASQPDDILWQNLQNSHRTIIIKKCYTFAVGFLVLFFGALIELVLSIWEINNKASDIHFFIVGLSSVLVTFVNYIISIFLAWATQKQGNITKSKYNASLNAKICIFQFINSGVFYTTSNLLASLLSQAGNFQNLQQIFAEKVTVFMIINALSEPLWNIVLDYFQIPNSIARFFIKRNIIKPTQKESNAYHELNDCKVPFKYAYVIKTIWLTCFYAPFVPIVAVISLAGLIFYYITMKISFRFFYKITEVRSNEANLLGLRLSYFTPFLLNLGQITTVIIVVDNFYQLTPSENTIMYVSLIFSIAFGLFPWYQVNQRLFFMPMPNQSNMNYQQAKKQFEITYSSKMFSKMRMESLAKKENHFFFDQLKKARQGNAEMNPRLTQNVLSAPKIRSMETLPSSRPFVG